MEYSVTIPSIVIFPILLAHCCSVNQRLPSDPDTIIPGQLFVVGMAYSEIIPVVVISPILLPYPSVNQRLPSGPVIIAFVPLPAVGMAYSVVEYTETVAIKLLLVSEALVTFI